jgi:hypothetical protein
MSKPGHEKHFGKLTSDERFRLMLAAAARDDVAEVERLAPALAHGGRTR